LHTHRADGLIVRTFIKVPGLTEERAAELARTLTAIDGVVDAEVFAEDEVASVLYDIRVDVPALVAAIKQAGYDAHPL
jgi:copper chaperone CopZ